MRWYIKRWINRCRVQRSYIWNVIFKEIKWWIWWRKRSKKKEFLEDGLEEDEIEELLEDASIYETFFVPEQTRLSKLKDLTLNIGTKLDKAFKAIEDEPKNSELIGILSTTNYNDKEKVKEEEKNSFNSFNCRWANL